MVTVISDSILFDVLSQQEEGEETEAPPAPPEPPAEGPMVFIEKGFPPPPSPPPESN